MTSLIEIGILPCLGLILLTFSLFYIFLKCLTHEKALHSQTTYLTFLLTTKTILLRNNSKPLKKPSISFSNRKEFQC